MTINCSSITKIRLFIHLLSCTQWLPQCITIYNYYYFKDLIYSFFLGYLAQLNQEQRFDLAEIISLLEIVLSQAYNNSRPIILKLDVLNKKLCNKIYKYYTATKQEEQLIAELYVYCLHTLMQVPENMLNPSIDILNKLIDLQSYRKQS